MNALGWISVLVVGTGLGGVPAIADHVTPPLALEVAPVAGPKADVPYVPTPIEVVNEMLNLAQVRKGDVIYDLGSGDGRLVIEATQKFGAKRGVGVEINPRLVEESRENAQKAGVGDRVQFLQQDLFATDIREASVVTLYLLPEVNLRLRPKLLQELRPGTRVVSHAFDMNEWKPDKTIVVGDRGRQRILYYWVIPANVAGTWRGTLTGIDRRPQPITFTLTQAFQRGRGTLILNGETLPLPEFRMEGDRIILESNRGIGNRRPPIRADGRVKGNSLNGTVEIDSGGLAGRYTLEATRR